MTCATSCGVDVRFMAVVSPMPPTSGPIISTALVVIIGPGETAFTRTFESASSAVQLRVSASSAAFVALYTDIPRMPIVAAGELGVAERAVGRVGFRGAIACEGCSSKALPPRISTSPTRTAIPSSSRP